MGPAETGAPRPRLSALLLVAVLLLAAGCTESASLEPLEGGPAQQIQDMLTGRADALAAGDVEGFLDPLEPAARAVEEPIAEQATVVPLSEVRLLLGDAAVTRREVDGQQVAAVNNAKVDFVFRYEGLPDDNPFWFRLRYDLEERDGTWRVTESRMVIPDMETPVPMPPMWALGPVGVARSEHFLALHRPGLGDVGDVLDLAEQARGRLVEDLTLEAAPSDVLQIAATDEEYGAIVSPAGGGRSIANVESMFADEAYAMSRIPTNRHMNVNLQAVFAEDLPADAVGHSGMDHGGMGHGPAGGAGSEPPDDDGDDGDDDQGHRFDPDFTPLQVFQHELGHLALSRFSRPSTPVWVSEGGAMQLAGEQRTTSWRLGLRAGVFEEMSFLNIAKRDPAMGLDYLEYAYVNAAVSHLVAEYGADTFWEFYRDFKEFDTPLGGHPLEQTHADGTNRLLRRIYDMDEEDLDGHARAWMRQAVG